MWASYVLFTLIALDFVPHMEIGTNVYLMGVSLKTFRFPLVVFENDNVEDLPERMGCG